MSAAPLSPQNPLRWAWRLTWVSVAAGLAVLFVTDYVYLVVGLGAWLPTAIALSLAYVSAKRSYEPTSDPQERLGRHHLWGALILSTVLLVAHLGSCRIAQFRAKQAIMSSISNANLRGIASALDQYVKDYAQPPPSLRALVDDNAVMPSQFIAPGDDSCTGYDDPCYRYQPVSSSAAKDRQLIVMYERGEWTPRKVRLCRDVGRWVLFADGRLEVLSGAEFQEAIRQDAERRATLGLPAPQTQPAIPPATRPS